MNPLVSIIIPTYNRAHLIGETLNSVLAQTYTNWECIVVDDGSSDGTDALLADYCEKDTRFQYHHRPPEHLPGGNGARNYGFKVSRGEYVKWFDSDDLIAKEALETYISILACNNELELLVSPLSYFSKSPQNLLKSNYIPQNYSIEDYLTGKISFYVSPPFWKKSFLDKQNVLFDEKISNLDDWDFNLRMLYEKPKIRVIQLPLILYRIHEDSLSKKIEKLDWKEISSEIYTREKHIKLLEENKLCNSEILKTYIYERLVYLYRESMVAKNPIATKLFFKVLKHKIRNYKVFGVFKTIIFYVVYKTFSKGYNHLN